MHSRYTHTHTHVSPGRRYAGVSHVEKIENVQDLLEQRGHYGWLFTALDEIACMHARRCV